MTILRSLHGCGVFQCPAEEMFERVKRNIKKESCDTGEAMSRLGIWYNPAMDVTKECLPFLTLVEKIRRQVCLRLDDIAFTFQAQQASRNSGLEDAVKKITELTAKLYKDTSCGEALEAQLMIETTDIQKNLLREKARLKQDIEEQGNMVDFCVRTMDRLLELEQQAFGGPTPGSSDIQRINLHKITKREQVSDFCAHVGGASDSLFLRCIILKTGQEAEQVIVGSTGKRNVLFEPRKGDIEFQSKQECVELLKNKLSAAINKGRAIEVTVWKNALISPPAVSVASAAPRIVEVDESSLGVPSHSSSSEGLPYTAPMEAVASASSAG